MGMEIEVARQGRVAVIALSGRMSLGSGDALLRDRFSRCLAAGDRRFVLDLRGVDSADSASLGEILACYRLARDVDGQVSIVLGKEGRVYEFFVQAHLDRVFPVFDRPEAALEALSAAE
jgi:anti-anti-sigma factor